MYLSQFCRQLHLTEGHHVSTTPRSCLLVTHRRALCVILYSVLRVQLLSLNSRKLFLPASRTLSCATNKQTTHASSQLTSSAVSRFGRRCRPWSCFLPSSTSPYNPCWHATLVHRKSASPADIDLVSVAAEFFLDTKPATAKTAAATTKSWYGHSLHSF